MEPVECEDYNGSRSNITKGGMGRMNEQSDLGTKRRMMLEWRLGDARQEAAIAAAEHTLYNLHVERMLIFKLLNTLARKLK